ncbi:hypothetical protein [Gulosibacter faecalis]|jgi:hypothetical protein|uniref:DNA primase n=1 Tax=Gulosibacter faecalis TaxID=272240 RepID=A0ABW5UYB4_9MICO|nr:hypothetical protein [Gulosibacter faecalis]
MPKYAVMLRYEVVSGLVVEAKDQDEAVMLATEYEANLQDSFDDTDEIEACVRVWGDGDVTAEAAADADEAADLLDEWADDLDLDDEDEDDYDEDDLADDEEFDEIDDDAVEQGAGSAAQRD